MSLRAGCWVELIFLVSLVVLTLLFTYRARSGKYAKIRRIVAFDAIPEAVGRSVETGKDVWYIPGGSSSLRGVNAPMTLAGFTVAGYVAEICASYDVGIKCTIGTYDIQEASLMLPVLQDLIRQSYEKRGKGDLYKPEMVTILGAETSQSQAAYLAMWKANPPGAIILLGGWSGDTALAAEAAVETGAITIGGTPRSSQLMKFVATMDYVVIAEEIYAMSALISKEPRILGSIQTQDVGKYAWIVLTIVGAMLVAAGLANASTFLSF